MPPTIPQPAVAGIKIAFTVRASKISIAHKEIDGTLNTMEKQSEIWYNLMAATLFLIGG